MGEANMARAAEGWGEQAHVLGTAPMPPGPCWTQPSKSVGVGKRKLRCSISQSSMLWTDGSLELDNGTLVEGRPVVSGP
jgi:hypothetical protein